MALNNHILITGGAGFIGTHLARRLISQGYEVTIIDNLSTGNISNLPRKAEFIKQDLSSPQAYELLGESVFDIIFHLAGQSSGEASFLDPFVDFKSHVLSTFLLLDWCRRKGCKRLIYASSMSVYADTSSGSVAESDPENPRTFYAAGKRAAECYIRLYQNLGMETTILRLFSVYGPGQNLANKMQGMVSIYLSFMLENAPVVVKGSKDRYRDFVYVDDVVAAFCACMHNPRANGEVFNVGSGEKTTVEELLRLLKNAFNRADYPVEYGVKTPGDQFGVVASISKIKQALEWQPAVALADGLRDMVDYERKRNASG